MATVILDVPTEKISSFVSLIMKLGIEKHRIGSHGPNYLKTQNRNVTKHWNSVSTLAGRGFDWELHQNELEFE